MIGFVVGYGGDGIGGWEGVDGEKKIGVGVEEGVGEGGDESEVGEVGVVVKEEGIVVEG